MTYQSYAAVMAKLSCGIISVIFVAQRTGLDADGYARAATMMNELAAQQVGYVGMDTVRGSDGLGITISYWTDEASAQAWRDHPEHAAIRDAGATVGTVITACKWLKLRAATIGKRHEYSSSNP